MGEFGKSKALAGLLQAANEIIEGMSNWGSEAECAVDDVFKSAGICLPSWTLSGIAEVLIQIVTVK